MVFALFHDMGTRALSIFCLILGMSSSLMAAVDTASPIDGATLKPQEEQRSSPVEGPRTGRVGESSGVFHMGASGCNAWVVDQNHIVTNNHCVDKGGVKLVFYRQGGKITIENCKPTPVARNRKLDYAVFQCANIGAKIPPVKIANRDPKTGEDFTLVTHDLSNPGQQRHAKGKMGAPVTLESGGTGYETTGATVISGNSGSVLYDKDGNAIGLVWGADTTNAKTGVMSSLRDVVADIKKQTTQVAFNLTEGDGRLVADATPTRPAAEVPRSTSEEPATTPTTPSRDEGQVRVAETPVTTSPVATTPVADAPASSAPINVAQTSARTDNGSFLEKHGTTIALVGAAVVGAFLVYKIIQDKNQTDRKYAEIQAQMYAQQNTTTTATTTSGGVATVTTPTTELKTGTPTVGTVSTVLKRDAVTNGGKLQKFQPTRVTKVPMMVKRLGAYPMPYLRTDYVQQRPAATAPSRRLSQESL